MSLTEKNSGEFIESVRIHSVNVEFRQEDPSLNSAFLRNDSASDKNVSRED